MFHDGDNPLRQIGTYRVGKTECQSVYGALCRKFCGLCKKRRKKGF